MGLKKPWLSMILFTLSHFYISQLFLGQMSHPIRSSCSNWIVASTRTFVLAAMQSHFIFHIMNRKLCTTVPIISQSQPNVKPRHSMNLYCKLCHRMTIRMRFTLKTIPLLKDIPDKTLNILDCRTHLKLKGISPSFFLFI